MIAIEEEGLTIAQGQPRSIIETISASYALLTRRLWVLLIPVVLDLCLWLGPQLSLARFLSMFRNVLSAFALVSSFEVQQREQFVVQLQNTDMRSVLTWLNFVPVLVPDLLGAGSATTVNVLHVSNPLTVLFTIIVLNLVALVISSIFLNLLAAGVCNAPFTWRGYIRDVGRAILGIGGYALCILGVGALFTLPLLFVMMGLAQVAPALVPLTVAAGFILWFWLYFYTGFAVEAVLLKRIDPLHAIVYSISVVRRYFLSTLGFVVVGVVIMAGMGVVWRSIADSWPGLLLALLGNAYLGSGLLVARLLFFRDRLDAIRQETGR